MEMVYVYLLSLLGRARHVPFGSGNMISIHDFHADVLVNVEIAN
jgi:hypothetical protein